MSIGWIKLDTNLHEKPEVIYLAATLSIPPLHVVGCLFRIWAWFDQHTVDGNAHSVTSVTLDHYVGINGFAQHMLHVGWLAENGHVLTLPNFDRHNGESAKKRALTAQRVALHRNKTRNADVTLEALPEKRREERKEKSSRPTKIVGLSTARSQKPEDVKRAFSEEESRSLRAAILREAL